VFSQKTINFIGSDFAVIFSNLKANKMPLGILCYHSIIENTGSSDFFDYCYLIISHYGWLLSIGDRLGGDRRYLFGSEKLSAPKLFIIHSHCPSA